MGGMGEMRGNMGMRGKNEVAHDDDVTVTETEEEDGGWGGDDVDDVVGDEVIVGEAVEDALGNGREPVAVELEDCLAFERLGHIKLRALVRGEALTRLKDAVNRAFDATMLAAVVQKIRVLAVDAGDDDLLESGNRCMQQGDVTEAKQVLLQWCDRRGCEVPFLQAFNLHQLDSDDGRLIKALSTCPRLAEAAAKLLGVTGVRLYQTSAFYKSPSHGETSWHTDLHTAPLDTNGMVTVWIALSEVVDLDHSHMHVPSSSEL